MTPELEPIKTAAQKSCLTDDLHRWRCCMCGRTALERVELLHAPDCCEDLARAVVDALPVNVAAFSKLMAQIGIGHFEAAKVIRAYKAALKG